jgi:radical SAM protein with 4Fe4S-binding SPASM domain
MPYLSTTAFRLPILGNIVQNNYVSLKRHYFNFLRISGLRPGPVVVHWLSTYRCNSNCVYCEASANESNRAELHTDQIKEVINQLATLKVRHFFISGGEPTLRKDLFEVIHHAQKRGLTTGMITNSLLFSKLKRELKAADFKSIWTSVDGLAETHNKNRGYPGAYQIVLDAIRYYTEIKIPLRVVNTMVHPGNYDELPQLYERLKEAGINRWRLALAIPVGRAVDNVWALTPEKIDRLFRFVAAERTHFDIELSEELGYLGCWDIETKNSPFICPSGLSFCVIMPDGHVLPCQVVYDNKYSEGNVLNTPFAQIWKSGFSDFRRTHLTGECTTCLHRRACNGGCWGRRVTEGGCLRSIWDTENYGTHGKN